jgi:hypothetical protein
LDKTLDTYNDRLMPTQNRLLKILATCLPLHPPRAKSMTSQGKPMAAEGEAGVGARGGSQSASIPIDIIELRRC